MPAIVLVGAQWGDEGKGKATDLLGDRVDFVVRYQGGNNAGHMFANYDGVLKLDGDVGRKKDYDPRSWGKAGEASMAGRVRLACEDLMSAGKRLT